MWTGNIIKPASKKLPSPTYLRHCTHIPILLTELAFSESVTFAKSYTCSASTARPEINRRCIRRNKSLAKSSMEKRPTTLLISLKYHSPQ